MLIIHVSAEIGEDQPHFYGLIVLFNIMSLQEHRSLSLNILFPTRNIFLIVFTFESLSDIFRLDLQTSVIL